MSGTLITSGLQLKAAGGAVSLVASSLTSGSVTLTLPPANVSGALLNNGSGTLTWQTSSAASAQLGTINYGYMLMTDPSTSAVIFDTSGFQMLGGAGSTTVVSASAFGAASSATSTAFFSILRPTGSSSTSVVFNVDNTLSTSGSVKIGDGGSSGTHVYILPNTLDATNNTLDSVLATIASSSGNKGIVAPVSMTSSYNAGSVMVFPASGTPLTLQALTLNGLLTANNGAQIATGLSVAGGITMTSGTLSLPAGTSLSVSQLNVATSIQMAAGATITSANSSQISVPNGLVLGGTNTLSALGAGVVQSNSSGVLSSSNTLTAVTLAGTTTGTGTIITPNLSVTSNRFLGNSGAGQYQEYIVSGTMGTASGAYTYFQVLDPRGNANSQNYHVQVRLAALSIATTYLFTTTDQTVYLFWGGSGNPTLNFLGNGGSAPSFNYSVSGYVGSILWNNNGEAGPLYLAIENTAGTPYTLSIFVKVLMPLM